MRADPEAVPWQSCPFKPFTLLITCSPQAFLQFHSVPLSKTTFLKWGKPIAEEVAVMGGRMHSAPPPAQHSELSFKSDRYHICWAGCFANRKLEESVSPAPALQGLVGYSQVKLLPEKQSGNLPGSLFVSLLPTSQLFLIFLITL